jgi:acetyltransferase
MPETAIELFHHISKYYRNQKLLLQTPEPTRQYGRPEAEGAKMLIEALLAERRKVLSEMESKAILRAFKVPVAQTMVARTATEALLLAEQIGFPIAMKVDSPDLPHKSDAGGVRLNIINAPAVRNAYHDIIDTVQKRRPDAKINGVSIALPVAPERPRTDDRRLPRPDLRAGHHLRRRRLRRRDLQRPLGRPAAAQQVPGQGPDRLDPCLQDSRAVPQHAAGRYRCTEGSAAVHFEMVCELPWIQEIDLNPLIVDENGAIAADARIVIDHASSVGDRYAHMSIYPYPVHLVQEWQMNDGKVVTIRPIRPEDADMEQEFVKNMSDESRYYRFMDTLRELTQTMLVRFTQIDYDREMALVATVPSNEDKDGIERKADRRRPLRGQSGWRVGRVRAGRRRRLAEVRRRSQADDGTDRMRPHEGLSRRGR